MNTRLRVGSREATSDLVYMLRSQAWGLRQEDFVVLKFDCDFNAQRCMFVSMFGGCVL